MTRRLKNRILSLVLCISMITSMFTYSMPVFSSDTDAGNTTVLNMEGNVGNQAIFDFLTDFLLIDENTLMNSTAEELAIYYGNSEVGYENWVLYDDINVNNLVVHIADYFYDEVNGDHWYKLEARDGEILPEVLQEKPWVYYANDADFEEGMDPYLVIYAKNDTIRFVNAEIGNYSALRFILSSASADLADADITITDYDGEYQVSSLAYIYEDKAAWSDAHHVQITKSNGEAWSAADGTVGIRYTSENIATDTYDEAIYYAGVFLYVGDNAYSATVTDKMGYDISDIVYTNAGSSVIVYEFLDPSFRWFNETGYFTNESVILYNNVFGETTFTNAYPTEFTAAYLFDYNGESYYWLEDAPFAGAHFIVKESDVTLGEYSDIVEEEQATVTDENGSVVTSISLPIYEKLAFTAASPLTGEFLSVSYQWQIEYEDGEWVDIYGEDKETINLSFAIVATLLDGNNSVNIRCMSRAKNRIAYSAPIPVTLDLSQPEVPEEPEEPVIPESEPEEPDVTVTESVLTSNGKTVTVNVTGSIPEGADVTLAETDSADVNAAYGTEAVAALDISIKNADGTEWQPESGETVTVTLEASSLGLEEGDTFYVYHTHNGEVKTLGCYTVVNNTVKFDVDGFSKFVFAKVVAEQNFDDCIDLYAAFNAYNEWIGEGVFEYFWLKADPENGEETKYEWSIYDDDFEIDQVVQIKSYCIDSEGALWFEVVPVNGLELPASLKERPWIHMNNLTQYDEEYDALNLFEPEDLSGEDIVIVDKYGIDVWDIYLYSNETKEVTVQTNLTGEVRYRWEACYDTTNFLWVEITGENSSTFKFTYAKLSGVLQDNEWAAIRCVAYNAAETVTSNVIIANVLPAEAYSISPTVYSADAADFSMTPMVYSTAPTAYLLSTTSETEPAPIAEDKVIVTLTAKMEDDTIIFQENYELEMNGTVSRPDTKIPYIKGYDLTNADGTGIAEFGTNDNGEKCYLYDVERSNVSESFEIILTYKPGATTYQVVYHLQNIENDNYVQSGEPVIIEGITGEMTNADNEAFDKYFEGFYQLLFESVPIASDGSTVIEVYYDRLYYKMLFDLDGGYGVQPVYARYGTPITVDNPSKAGYAFLGWNALAGSEYSDGKDDTADIPVFEDIPVPAEHTQYKALWQVSNMADVSVIIWGENANDNEYSYIKSDVIQSKPGSAITYNPNGGYICGMEAHSHGTNCIVECGNEEHEHSIADNCYSLTCGRDDEHTEHNDDCCKLDGIKLHTIDCYQVNGEGALSTSPITNQNTINGLNLTSSNSNGLYPWKNDFYFKFDGQYYQIDNADNDTKVELKENCGCTDLHEEHDDSCCEYGGLHTHSDSCYQLNCAVTVHTHKANCYSCGTAEHTHGGDCILTITGMDENKIWEYSHSDTVSGVAADGSSVLNVYFDRKEYTLKFYYAASINQYSSNTKNNTTYYVVGGSTYQFGSQAPSGVNDKSDEVDLLDHYMTNYTSQRGEVSKRPELTEDGADRGYTLGETTSADSGYTYYYVSFTAKYGANIYNLWPTEAFDSIYCYNTSHAQLDYAYVSAWNGEHHVYYSQHNDNETIKGKYSVLDENLLWDYAQFGAYADAEDVDGDGKNENAVAFLCFWENGANVGWSVPELYRYNIYVEPYEGMDTTGLMSRTYGGKTYYLMERYETIDDSDRYSQTYPEIEGFAHIDGYYEKDSYGKAIAGTFDADQLTAGTDTTDTTYDQDFYQDGWDLYFYYDRLEYELVFYNESAAYETRKLVPFQASLGGYNYVPEPPVVDGVPAYQEGSVVFAGWYENPECQGDAFDFSGSMPANAVILYAKWQPVEHHVTFYYTYADLEANNVYAADGITFAYNVPHGSTIKTPYTPPSDPENGAYEFVGWFYRDANGQEQMWDFDNTTVAFDVKIYAKWLANTLVRYTVKFVFQDENGNKIEIADPITGSALAGSTKTFDAKVGTQLKADYQTRYFPIDDSHSINIDIDESKNVYTFYYLYRETVPYTVYYLTKNDPGKGLGTKEYNGETYYLIADTRSVNDNDKAIVTENAPVISSYVFDDYQKRLDIDPTEGAVNEIYFFYEKDTVNGQYIVHYMTQNAAGNGFDEHSAFTGKQPDGSVYTVPTNPPKEIEHFTWAQGYNDGVNIEKLTGSVTVGDVLELWVYYTRNTYHYTVKYLDETTGQSLHTEKTDSARWESQITETYAEIDGYDLVSDTSYTIDISDDAADNVITFYYVKDVTINYVVVGPAGCGTVNPASETLGAISDMASGSTAAAASTAFKFVGWYGDAECKTPVTYDTTNNKFTPAKVNNRNVAATYYAKFEYNLTTLTIVKDFDVEGDYASIDPNQTFIFNVQGNGVDLNVTVHGSDWSVVIDGLTVGQTYQVTEITDWSWRYNCTGWEHKNGETVKDNGTNNPASITIGLNDTITFTNTRDEAKWLDGDSWCNNIFKSQSN